MRVKATPDAITALNHNSVLVCFKKFIIKDDRPLGVIDFSMTMGHENTVWALATKILCGEGFKCIWELSFKKEWGSHTSTKPMRSYSPSPGRQHAQMLDMMVLTFCPSTHSPSQDKSAIV